MRVSINSDIRAPRSGRSMSVIAGVALFSLILSLVASLVVPFTASAATATLFTNGFESSNFSAWTSANDDWSIINDTFAGSKAAEVKGANGDELRKNVSTLASSSLVLSYGYKIPGGLDSGDHVKVQWSTDGVTWNTIVDYAGTATMANWATASHNLSVGAENNSGFRFRFYGYDLGSGDKFRLDSVLLVSNAPYNNAPVAQAKSVTTKEDFATSTAVLATDADVPAQTLTYSMVSGPTNGVVTGLPNTTGAFTYTPATNYNGADSFAYKASDGTASSTATVSITVSAINDIPSFTKGADQTVNEDAGLQTILAWAMALIKGPLNESAQTLSFTVTNNNNGLFSTQPSVAADGMLTFTPDVDMNGLATVTIFVQDNGGTLYGGVDTSASQTFTIAVLAINDAPVALDDSYSGDEDTPFTTGNVVANDIDIDGDTLYVSASDTTSVHGGTVAYDGNGVFIFTPAANYYGFDEFSYTVSDGSDTDTGLVTILISNDNDAPVASADAYSVNEDDMLTVLAGGVLDNDSDVDGGALTATLVNDVSNGTLAFNTDGSFTYTPDANYNGSDSFTYHANDNASAFSGDVVVTITINPSNDAPVAQNQSLSTVQDTNLAGTVTATDIDLPANTLTFGTTSNPTNGTLTLDANTGAFVYAPNAAFVGSDSFTFVANDGTASSNTATISIDVTAAPVIVIPVENDAALCSDGIDNDNDQAIDLADSDCAAFVPAPVVVTPPANNSGGSGPTGGGNVIGGPLSIGFVNTNTGGQVLGTSTEEALPAGCELYIKTYMKMGAKNDTTEVKKLQTFLNTHMNANLPVTGIFGPLTFAAVNAFQIKHFDEVLAPWVAYGLPTDHTPTGYVYKTTKRMINLVQCNHSIAIPQPMLP